MSFSFKFLPVVELTVSAGQNKDLHLPEEDNVNLQAYVIPEDPPNGGTYRYKWEVISSPDDPDGTSVMMPSGRDMLLSKVIRIYLGKVNLLFHFPLILLLYIYSVLHSKLK